ncbi:MAG: hypothetical protein ACR2QB_04180 [Gammaproteobacteria bacterium]
MYRIFVTICLVSLLVSPVIAQQNVRQPDLRSQMSAARDLLEKERRIVLAGEMNLTNEERDKFWKLFNEYVQDLKKVNDVRVDVIIRYSESYRTMTNEIARGLLDDRFRYEREMVKLREKYLKRMRRILPETKVARFFHVESKMDAALNYNLAATIPVIQDPPTP